MVLTEFMIKDVFTSYKSCNFTSVIIHKHIHDEHKSFLYVVLTTKQGVEIHLTTDGAYPDYEHKRLSTPNIVYIFDRFQSIKTACLLLNFLI